MKKRADKVKKEKALNEDPDEIERKQREEEEEEKERLKK